MSLALHELLLCCRHLENDKATERRKEIEKFKRLLRDSETVQHLDRNSDGKHGNLNWDIVFRFLQKYVQKETESLKLAKANVSSATKASRHKKMQELSSLVKYFIRCANQRAPRLKLQDLLNHVMDTVKDSMSSTSCRADYSSILLKDILSVRKYWCEISQHQWADMLTSYFKLYLQPSNEINRVLLARIIHTLVRGCCLQMDGLSSKLFDFFSKAMQHVRNEVNPAGLEQILAALNIFLRVTAANCRLRVCRLGEEILPTILRIWNHYRPKDSLKEEIIELLQLQLHIHHPKGVKTSERGAYAHDSVKWQKILQALYDILVDEISQIGSRGKYSSGSRHIAVKENLVELTSDICHQLFTEDTRVLEVTQLSFVAQRESLDGAAPNKRRRIELGWEVVRENLQRSHNDFDIIPWLQITTCLIAKYPESFPSNELTAVLTVLHQLLSQQRRGERAPYVLKCLMEIAICQNQKMDLQTTHKLELQKVWAKIWAVTLRSISSQQTETEGFGLLEAIIRGGLVHVDRDLWKIFSGSTCKPSSPAVHCLALALTSYALPENLKIETETSISDGTRGYTLKELIMQWLLFYQLNEDTEENPEPSPVICRDFPHLLIQKILVSLAIKDCNNAMRFFQNMTECVQDKKSRENIWLSENEEIYLLTEFDEVTLSNSLAVKITDRKLTPPSLTVNQNFKEKLDNALLEISKQLLNSYSCETSSAENLVRCAALLTGVLGCYCCAGILTEEEACQSELFQKAKSAMHYAGESISFLKTKLTEESKIISLRNLIMQCTNCIYSYSKNSLSRISSDLFLCLLTSRMVNELAEICKHLVACTRTPSDAVEINMGDDPEDNRMEEEEDAITMDLFDDNSAQDMNDINEVSELQSITGAVSPLAEEHLTNQDMLLLDTLRFLCLCVTAAQLHSVSFRAPDICRKLLSLIDHSMLDTTKSLQLHVYLTLLKELPDREHLLPIEDVVKLLKPLPDVCSLYRRDQEVCVAILTCLLPTVASLAQGQAGAEETGNSQGQFLTIIQAFWHLSKEGKCTVAVRVALMNCFKTLLEADPHVSWAILTIDKEDVPVSDIFPQFFTDSHHKVRMLAAKSVNRLFQDVKTQDSSGFVQALPLKLQQKAFENVYMKVQEGMRHLSSVSPEELPDEQCNRKATLLMLVSKILCCSPVCEKQALFAIYQSAKENGIEPQLVKKVFKCVSAMVGYKSIEDFMTSHLDYLVLEWLRVADSGYSLSAFPYALLNYPNLEEFYRSCYNVLIPHLVIRSDFEEVKSLARLIGQDWQRLLAECFPKVLVNILPYFAYQAAGDSSMAQLRDKASNVYEALKHENCLGKQQIDNLFLGNLPDIVVELLMTLHETSSPETGQSAELVQFAGELDPAPNPPCFPSYVIKATLDYISSCHKSKLQSLVAILSKSPDSFQKILLAICKQAAETNNNYKKHRILLIYHLFVNLLLKELKDGLGGAWAFVLRDVIYTLIHHINSRSSLIMDEVSMRSTLLCCDLLNLVCQTAVTYCGDALESHLHVIVGSLILLVEDRREIQQEVLNLLNYLIIENKDNENLYHTIQLLDPLPDHPIFRELRVAQQSMKYSRGPFSLLKEINHFLSVSVCDSLPLTRLEGLNDLRKQLSQHKDQMKQLVKEFQENPQDSVIVKLVVNLLQLSKAAANHSGGNEVLEAVGSCLGELGPIDFCTIALQHSKDTSYSKAVDLFEDKELQWIFIILNLINNALTDCCVQVRSAAAICLRNILATKSSIRFWEMYKNKTDPLLVYLQPFRGSKKKFVEVPHVEREEPPDSLDDGHIWIPQSICHDSWLKNLACTLLDSGGVKSEVLQQLRPLCEVQTDFCQTVLPYLIHSILLQDPNKYWRTLVSRHIQGFFSTCCRSSLPSSRSTTPANSDSEPEFQVLESLDKISRRTMLGVVDYLRRQKRPFSGAIFDESFWLELNYLEVAMTAQSCAAHFTALLYAEIYADRIKLEDEKKKSKTASTTCRSLTFEEDSQSLTISSLSEKSKEESGISLQDLLMEIYRSIGEPDSLYGCGGGKMLQPLARIRTYEHEAMWGKALVTYDLEMNLPTATRHAGVIQALQNFGLCHTLSTYLKGLEHENAEWSKELQEIRYQAAWRNMQWDHSPTIKNEVIGPGYHESLYSSLQSLRDREFSGFYESLKYARVKEVEELCRGSLESVYSLYPTLCRLQSLGELESIGHLFSRPVIDQDLKEVYKKWQQQSHLLKDCDFSFQESIMALRTVILEILMEKETNNSKRECIKDIFTNHLVALSTLARTAKNNQLPERAIFQIKQCIPAQFQISEWQLEEAKVYWAKKEQSLALGILKHMIGKLDAVWFEEENDPAQRLIYAECLRLCGNWLAETCLESPTVIMQMYLEKAVKVATSQTGGSSSDLQSGKMKAFLSLARFSDAQYQRIENYMKSSEFDNKQALLKKAKDEVLLIREYKMQVNRYTVKVQRELELDECAIASLKEDRQSFLRKAIENYISCLVGGEEHDIWIFRLCSLWLENHLVSEVNDIMKEGAQKIPSYKFLPLMYQLAARMGTKKKEDLKFHDVLNNLIARISMNHPYHTLFIILALANANKDDFLLKPEAPKRTRLSKSTSKQISQLDMDRMEAALNIVNTIKCHRPKLVQDVERLCDAYIILANMDASQWKAQRKAISIPADQPIIKLKDLDEVVIPTMEVKVDLTGNYENLVTVRSFKPEFCLAGGVNLPKIIDCMGSDGKERRQLVKGRDDLRQDAVMQQVFQMCNLLLHRNTETRKRKLMIRTYKVIPLSQRSGVLEWCSGTLPIGEYLVNLEDGAHKRYRPNDYSNMQCQKKMVDVQKERLEDKCQVFLDVCQHFQPVFRYFCMEKFLDPAVWFEKRLAYTRSVATSSIVGYIVGLGDRHVQNILIDEETAELVHIDLGVAFEQGKILPTPETVPFRLTRDIVDGMGITGVEGVFRRCCEKTIEVMRNSQEALLTIAEVLLYDPLFDWTMSPLKAMYLQQDEADLNATLAGDDQECNGKDSSDKSFNKVAERVLLRLQEKLKGVEESTVLSVGGQVNLLIQQAMDPKNLSRLFPGWKPWI
uniref:non-specific serine/threonine protein kinase n=1 Tax=Geotrypetes seraphini TaxID=260995 RepID=A0A6P8RJK5_GEOSA|nr:serine-protein kinase ATM isoform X2 [Geotrypetes seraphini]